MNTQEKLEVLKRIGKMPRDKCERVIEENYPRKDLIGVNKPWRSIELPNYSKIIFLNKTNLVELEGYKASVKVFGELCGKQEIHIVLTGFSFESAKRLFDKLKELPKNEVYSDKEES